MSSATWKPLAGVRVLDLTRVLSGPHCTMVLSDLGADVVKIERPGTGDDNRRVRGFRGRNPHDEDYFYPMNRGKKSIELDLKDKDDIATLFEFARYADVVINNFAPGVVKRLGFSPEDLWEIAPSLTYVSISGFGQTGAYARRKAYDAVVQAAGGLMTCWGQDERPARPGFMFADLLAGMFGVVAVLEGVTTSRAIGRGVYRDISMLDSVVSAWLPRVNWDNSLNTSAFRKVVLAGGRSIVVQIDPDKDLPCLEGMTVDRAAEALESTQIAWAPMNTLTEYSQHEQTLHRKMVAQLDHQASGKINVINSPFVVEGHERFTPSVPPPILGSSNAELPNILDAWRQGVPKNVKGMDAITVCNETSLLAGALAEQFLLDLGASRTDQSNSASVVITEPKTGSQREGHGLTLSISPWGATGPWKDRPGNEQLVQAMTGLMSITGDDKGRERLIPLPLVSLVTALCSVQGVLARHLSGITAAPLTLDLAMADCIASLWSTSSAEWCATGVDPKPMGTENPNRCPAGAFRAQDGWISIMPGTDGQWLALCNALDLNEFAQVPQFLKNEGRITSRDEINTAIEDQLRNYPAEKAVEQLVNNGVPAAALATINKILGDSELQSRGTVQAGMIVSPLALMVGNRMAKTHPSRLTV